MTIRRGEQNCNKDREKPLDLHILGWNDYFSKAFKAIEEENYLPLRITREDRGLYTAEGSSGTFQCRVTGRYRWIHSLKSEYPAVGDWVAASSSEQCEEDIDEHEDSETLRKALIHSVLPRRSAFSRKVAGEVTEEQVVAANINTLFIVTGLDENFNTRRIERYLTLAWESGAQPVVLLNKADLCTDSIARLIEVEEIAAGSDVHLLSAIDHMGLQELKKYFREGSTAAFIGSSGVGKSTIINEMLGTGRQDTQEVSGLGSRGRHTTTRRELIVLPKGGMVIDTPGLREIQVWGDEEGLERAFDDIEELAQNCRFRDCSHDQEPGCMIQEALAEGTLPEERFASYLKLKREFAYHQRRKSVRGRHEERDKWKKISKLGSEILKHKRGAWGER